jgi:hypothetical protein
MNQLKQAAPVLVIALLISSPELAPKPQAMGSTPHAGRDNLWQLIPVSNSAASIDKMKSKSGSGSDFLACYREPPV